ncbi:hypothetical protein [Paenibacillus amylolyticus]|uniref:hypothetical protein n=1 Tax=Paenibacillus amylolyticus TaxID=1451 RepID=UPI00249BC165|nr:hypothetical protein [Paenibacillus amylolyticus]WFA86485.1 hypothetical protein OGI70_06035 [Paenibacillus amylolyticus]
MTQTTKVKLSQLTEDTQLSFEGATCAYTALQVRELISEDGEWALYDWQVCSPRTWKPSAETMIDNYIDQERDEMYEEWDVDAAGKVTKEGFAEIQAVIEKMFGEYQYWMFDGPEVIIDSL